MAFRNHVKIVPSCSSVVDNYVIPEVEQSGSVSGPCVRLHFSVRRQLAFYCLAVLAPVCLCTLPLLALLVPRPLSRDGDVTVSRDGDITGGRFDRRTLRVPALLTLTGVFIFQLHFVSGLLRTRLSIIGNNFMRVFTNLLLLFVPLSYKNYENLHMVVGN